jgi:N-acetylglutamate synthase-like GNAT family acetyltransferase
MKTPCEKEPMASSEKPSIVQATRKDINGLASLIKRSFADVAKRFALTPQNCPKHPSNCTREWINRDLNRNVHYFVLISDGIAVGCVGIERASETTCYMERLAVVPEQRGKGYGIRLARHALDQAKSMGAAIVGIGIIAADTDLKNFYIALGFKEGITKTFPHLPFEVVFMEALV